MTSTAAPARRTGKRVPAAKGLEILTHFQVETIDRLLAQVCQAGDGELVIVVKRGNVRIARPTLIVKLKPTVEL